MRVAIVDLLFSWPPHGGADVDVFHLAHALQTLGIPVELAVTHEYGSWERGASRSDDLPFRAKRIDFSPRSFTIPNICRALRAAVEDFAPTVVILADGFFLKPYVLHALRDFPVINRYFAYEAVCSKDILWYRDGRPCPHAYPRTPDICRRCAAQALGTLMRRGLENTWLREYLLTRAYTPEYYFFSQEALKCARATIVYNPLLQRELLPLCPETICVPSGITLEMFPYSPPPYRTASDIKIILMTGRAEDPMKGASVLIEAAERLRRKREDFEVWITLPEETPTPAYVKCLGWIPYDDIPSLYAKADICVVPSVWEEPFGIVALEAMATGRPVCASRAGGLAGIVIDGETGFLFERGNSAALADALEVLLEDPALRKRMGAAGHERAASEYTWRHIVEQYYIPLFHKIGS